MTLMQDDIDWNEVPRGQQGRQALAVGRGLKLAAPLVSSSARSSSPPTRSSRLRAERGARPGQPAPARRARPPVRLGERRARPGVPLQADAGRCFGRAVVPARRDGADGRARAPRSPVPRVRARPASLLLRRCVARRRAHAPDIRRLRPARVLRARDRGGARAPAAPARPLGSAARSRAARPTVPSPRRRSSPSPLSTPTR